MWVILDIGCLMSKYPYYLPHTNPWWYISKWLSFLRKYPPIENRKVNSLITVYRFSKCKNLKRDLRICLNEIRIHFNMFNQVDIVALQTLFKIKGYASRFWYEKKFEYMYRLADRKVRAKYLNKGIRLGYLYQIEGKTYLNEEMEVMPIIALACKHFLDYHITDYEHPLYPSKVISTKGYINYIKRVATYAD